MIGQTLSHYKIIEKLGAGGQGEVYLAEDSRLDRKVALKILPQHLSDRADLRERFEREARAVSSLNHPHICTLYDIGEQDGIHYLVMEHLEGDTLAARLEKGALPLEQTLQYAIQIADALDKAHRQGVVHRDLKPGNIMLTKGGAKLLDFGLAKLQAKETPTNLSALPTEQANLTAEGTILGTLQYMAPEQLEAKEADARTDIFAFGAVVYEMATGKKAFEGGSQASLISAIMKDDPPAMAELQPMTPSVLDRVIKKCLAKEPDSRWQSASDLHDELGWIAEGNFTIVNQLANASIPPVRGWRFAISLVLAALVVGATIGVIGISTLRPMSSSETRPVSRLTIELLPHQQLQGTGNRNFALSPDGDHLAYLGNAEDGSRYLYLRSMGSLEARLVAGTEGAENPFFSPNNQWVGFFASGKLKKVSIKGGAPVTICDSPTLWGGASWGPDDTIIFAPTSTIGLLQVPASGGTPQVLTTLDSNKGEISHRWPHFLPGGKAVVFNASSGPSWSRWPIVVQSLETGERRVLVEEGTDARYSPTGHLVYVRAGTLMAVPFDLERLEVTGEAMPVLEGVRITPEGAAQFGFSSLESLVYIPGPVGEPRRRLVWLDRNGEETPLQAPPRSYSRDPRLSPDGQRIAASIAGGKQDVWVYDILNQTLTRLTFEDSNQFPVWTPDGKRITFRATRGGSRNLWWRTADGSGLEEQLTSSENNQSPSSWSPDGRVLAYNDGDPVTRGDIWVLSLEGERKAQPFLQTQFRERGGSFSPDGRWLAYDSDESGTYEVYVQPFPGPGRKWQVSTEGGGQSPKWAQNGRELFYASGNKMMAVDIRTQPTFDAGQPRVLFEVSPALRTRDGFRFDTHDGQRFLSVRRGELEVPATKLTIILNWFEELKRLVPTDN